MSADLSIQKAFLDGINLAFSIMFTQEVELFLMDDRKTDINIYNETPLKRYQDKGYKLVAKVLTTFEQGEQPIEGVQVDAVITVPTKQLILNGISRSTEEDLSILSRGKISYKGIDYLIHHVVPKTLVADEWQMYDFICFIDKKEIP